MIRWLFGCRHPHRIKVCDDAHRLIALECASCGRRVPVLVYSDAEIDKQVRLAARLKASQTPKVWPMRPRKRA